jgi:hypothetical protein
LPEVVAPSRFYIASYGANVTPSSLHSIAGCSRCLIVLRLLIFTMAGRRVRGRPSDAYEILNDHEQAVGDCIKKYLPIDVSSHALGAAVRIGCTLHASGSSYRWQCLYPRCGRSFPVKVPDVSGQFDIRDAAKHWRDVHKVRRLANHALSIHRTRVACIAGQSCTIWKHRDLSCTIWLYRDHRDRVIAAHVFFFFLSFSVKIG